MLEGQIALITGASSGIGRATAEAMARQGARVAVNYCKNREGAEAAVSAISKAGGEAMAVGADVTSIAGRNGGGPGAAAYAAAKGGLLTYTKGLAKELAPYGVRVNAVAPGLIATPYHERYSPPELFQKYVASVPLGRAGTSEEVADVIVFLASPAARYMTGETVEVNGGMWTD